ncbi:MAG: hypothetical protein SFW67_31205 [Myxococcaceae bacterium]|nr:hypothetical protein [Myxococcaceae bacterium]
MRAVLVALFVGASLAAMSCGPVRCTSTSCPTGLVCDPNTLSCLERRPDGGSTPPDAGRSDAGARDAGPMPTTDAGPPTVCGSCSLATPLCDEASRRCVRCTASQGCFGDTPVCDLSFQGGLGKCERCVADGGGCSGATPVCDVAMSRCVGCLRNGDCPGARCDLLRQVCVDDDGGVTPFDAGVGGPSCPGPRDGGSIGCVTECPSGFTCQGNECVLNGGAADLQVTLRWDSTEDLDLYVEEPLTDGGTCEIFYGARTPACAAGALDLDSQAACSMDLVLIENVVYPVDGGLPPTGTYAVRVNHFATCSPIQWVPFRVEVRKGAATMGLCGVFKPSDPDWNAGGGAGAGRPVMTFSYP